MRGFETQKGYDMRLVFDAVSGEFRWLRTQHQLFAAPVVQSQSKQTKQAGE